MSDTLSSDTIQAFLAAQQANAVDQTIQQQNNQAAVQQAVEQQQQQVPAQQDTQQPPAPVPAPTQQTPRTIQRNSDGQDVTDQAQVSPVSMLTDGSPVPNMQAHMPSDTPSFAGIRSSVDPDATSKDGKPVPFYSNPSFYNNLMNFGAATLAASGETDARGVPMNGLAAIGKGIVGAVNANRQERETQSQINEQNSNSAYKAADADAMRWRNYTEAQKARLFSSLADDISGDDAGNTSQGSSGNQGFSLSPNVDKDTALDANAAGNSRLLSALGQTESGNDYTQMNQYGYAGKYQLGQAALQHAGMYQPADGESIASMHNTWNGQITVPGYGAMTVDQFRNNPGAQEVAMTKHLHTIAQDLEDNGAADYIGKTINGVQITPAALVSGAHVAGVAGMMNFLHGSNSFKDGNHVNIPAYIQKVNDHISNDAVTGDNSPAMTAQSNARDAAYGNIVQGIHGADNLDAQINHLTKVSTAYSAVGLNPSAINSRLDQLNKLRYARQQSYETSQGQLPAETAKLQYGYDNAPIVGRDGVLLPDSHGGKVAVRMPSIVDQVDAQGRMHHTMISDSVQQGPNGPIVTPNNTDLGYSSAPQGFADQQRLIAEGSQKIMQDASNAADASRDTRGTAKDIRDIVNDPNFSMVGPGSSTLANAKNRLMGLAQITGFDVSDQMKNDVANYKTLAQLTNRLAVHTLGETAHVRTGSEYKSILAGNVDPDNPIATIQFNVAAINGASLDDMAYNKFLQNNQDSSQGGTVFNARKARETYLEKVDPRTMMWIDMQKNGGNYGKQYFAKTFGQPGNQTISQKKNLAAFKKSYTFLTQNNALPDLQ